MTSFRLVLAGALVVASCGGGHPAHPASAPQAAPSIADGEALIQAENYGAAAALFDQILAADPKSAEAHYYLGLSKSRLGDPKAAEAHYRLALERDPELLAARNNLGLLLVDSGRLEEAETHLRFYLERQKDDPAACFNYGLLLEHQKRYDEAKVQYERAAALDPKDPAPWQGLGDLARIRGDLGEAARLYRAGREAAPGAWELAVAEGQTLFELGRGDEALPLFEPMAVQPGIDPELLTTAGALVAQWKHEELAMRLYARAIDVDRASAEAHFLLANALARAKRFAEAAEHYAAFLAIAPEAPQAAAARQRLEACRAQTP